MISGSGASCSSRTEDRAWPEFSRSLGPSSPFLSMRGSSTSPSRTRVTWRRFKTWAFRTSTPRWPFSRASARRGTWGPRRRRSSGDCHPSVVPIWAGKRTRLYSRDVLLRSVLDVAAVGDICVDFLTPPLKGFSLGDRQLWIPTLPMAPGGNAANFALGASALGLRTGLAACLGDDATSAYLRRVLRAANVTSFLKVRRGLEAGRTVALAHADGTRQLITANGSNLALSPSDISAKVCETRHLHRAGYWWTPKLLGKPTRDLLRRARDRGAETSLDVSTDPEGWPERRRAKVLAVLPEVSVFFGNEDEVRSVFGTRSLAVA